MLNPRSSQTSAYNDQFGDNFTSVIPTNIFGPGDNYTIGDAHVIPELMHKALLAKSTFPHLGPSPPPLSRLFIFFAPLGQKLTTDHLFRVALLQRPERPSPSLELARL